MREHFSMGRHSLVDCFYLCQTYARIPKHLLRDNANLKSNKGFKYKKIIAPLMCIDSAAGHGGAGVEPQPPPLPSLPTMRVTDNAIDYVHWDDPNELVDRLRLIEASRDAGNDSHDAEFLSIIEELREAGIITI
ncbi:hypothetical protein X777_04182 [Ooceraea biroi]|uniref:Uncharacterized protein n=1 Tax=Ooceraea biroi TaxID=2015173 RepID=A0A026WI85_OOCBI|nr:hypothetical protein X777_04182 [Ooceraea biroi]